MASRRFYYAWLGFS